MIKENKKYNKWTAVKDDEYRISKSGKCKYKCWIFKCECGVEKSLIVSNVLRGLSRQCAKCGREPYRIRHKDLYKTRFYNIWDNMKRRSSTVGYRDYERYGGSGRTLDEESWKMFDNFADDMYESYTEHSKEFKEKDTSLDRINNDKGYSKENCRWATQKVQCRNTNKNRNITFKGKTMCLIDWANKLNVSYQCLQNRFKYGWKIEKVLTPTTQPWKKKIKKKDV